MFGGTKVGKRLQPDSCIGGKSVETLKMSSTNMPLCTKHTERRGMKTASASDFRNHIGDYLLER